MGQGGTIASLPGRLSTGIATSLAEGGEQQHRAYTCKAPPTAPEGSMNGGRR